MAPFVSTKTLIRWAAPLMTRCHSALWRVPRSNSSCGPSLQSKRWSREKNMLTVLPAPKRLLEALLWLHPAPVLGSVWRFPIEEWAAWLEAHPHNNLTSVSFFCLTHSPRLCLPCLPHCVDVQLFNTPRASGPLFIRVFSFFHPLLFKQCISFYCHVMAMQLSLPKPRSGIQVPGV